MSDGAGQRDRLGVEAEIIPPSAEQIVAPADAVDTRNRAAMVLLAGSGMPLW